MALEKRQELSNGFRWWRHLVAIVGFFMGMDMIGSGENLYPKFMAFIICAGLYYLLYRSRKMHFNSDTLFIIFGKKEIAVPFTAVESIKKSTTKVNSERYWILRYTRADGSTGSCRYFPAIFNDNHKEFNALVKTANPEVIIWDHPHFHD